MYPPPPEVGKATAQISWLHEAILSNLIRSPAKTGKWPTVEEAKLPNCAFTAHKLKDVLSQAQRDPNTHSRCIGLTQYVVVHSIRSSNNTLVVYVNPCMCAFVRAFVRVCVRVCARAWLSKIP